MTDFRVEFCTPNGGKVSQSVSAENEWQAIVSATCASLFEVMVTAAQLNLSPLKALEGMATSAEDGSLDIHVYEKYTDWEGLPAEDEVFMPY